MTIGSRAICGALALAVIVPVAARAQSERNPFAELFGRAPDRDGREFTALQFRSIVGAQMGQTIEADFLGAVPEGLAGVGTATLDFDYARDRIQAGIFSRYSHTAYESGPGFDAGGFDGGGRVNIEATTRLSVQAGGRYARSPFFRLYWLAPEAGGQFLPADRGAIMMMQNETVEANVGVTSQYTKRSTLSAHAFMRDTRFDDLPQQSYSVRGGRASWRRQVRRDLAVHAGYGREELRPQVNSVVRSPIINEIIDIGVDYARSLEIARRTNLSFATGTAMLRRTSGFGRFRVNGNVNLERYFKRTWVVQFAARRATEFMPGFRAPVFTDRGNVALAGYLSKRLILNLHADAGQGEVAFYDARKFVSYAGDARLTLAASRHVGVFAQYQYYQYQNPPDPTLLTFVPRMSRQALSIGVQAWVPLLDREKVTSDTR